MGAGDNEFGELGLGELDASPSFIEIPFLSNIDLHLQFSQTKFASEESVFIQQVPNPSPSKALDVNVIAAIVIPIAFVALLIVFVALFFYVRRKFRPVPTQLPEVELMELLQQNVTLYKTDLIEGSTRTYRGNYTGKPVALKKIISKEGTDVANEVFILQ